MKFLNFNISSPLFLAPMAGITDLSFRTICKEMGAGLLYSEMISSRALTYKDKKTFELLKTNSTDKPLIIQLFGNDPDTMTEAAKIIFDMGFLAIDVNMGCPAPKIVNNGDGSALMKNIPLASKIIEKMKTKTNMPITVKFRKGFNNNDINAKEFALAMENSGADALCLHGRTREDYYAGDADLNIIKEVKDLVSIPLIGNGNVFSKDDAKSMMEKTNCDFVMIGRGALGNPWIFSDRKPTKEELFNTALKHLDLILENKGSFIGIREARKHMSWYIKGLKFAANAKNEINKSETKEEMTDILYKTILSGE